MADVVIIGAGAVGCAAAYELAKYKLSVVVVDKESDVCEGTTKANSAIVHAGFDAEPGTLKARLNVRGSEMMEELSNKLDFAYKRNEAMVLCFDKDISGLEALKEKADKNGVKGVSIISGDEARALEPNLTDEVQAALLAKTSAIVCPFEMTLAFAENAYTNGAEFKLSCAVTGIDKDSGGYIVHTSKGDIKARCVINAAGVYADRIHAMVSGTPLKITPRKGEYMLMDKTAGGYVSRTIFQLPTKMGKGILVTPTVHGNLLAGPTAENIDDKENTSTTKQGLADVKAKGSLSVKNIPFNKVITSFTGLRAVGDRGDFIIEECSDAPLFFDAAGIESPGLTSAPAIGEYLRELIEKRIPLEKKEKIAETRKGITHFAALSEEEQDKLIKETPAYGKIVCRCETVTEGEILDAISRPLGATTLDGVKRRTRAGMGRCQAGFCSPTSMALIAKKLGIRIEDVRKNGVYESEVR
ncbi:MAG: NAD(P)/FAD-dependent oxidoreductase [Ruminococcus sp.]|nr:NAD(P)/FAD-dependent oxidoreductase [Ruminococcus sp.]